VTGKYEGNSPKKGNPGIKLQMPKQNEDAQPTNEKQKNAPVDKLVRKLGDAFQKWIAIRERDHIAGHPGKHVLDPQRIIGIGFIVFNNAFGSSRH
jgi:hypothetical protein